MKFWLVNRDLKYNTRCYWIQRCFSWTWNLKSLKKNRIVATVHKLGKGNGTPLQYSCLENPTDGGAWWAAVHGVSKTRPRLSNFTFTFHFHALEKEMATHSSVLAWRIPRMVEPGGLPSMGSHRIGHNWSDLAAAAEGGYTENGGSTATSLRFD